MTTKKRPRGRPPTKAPGGLTEVLYVRCDAKLIAALDARAEALRIAAPGRGVSRADVARALLCAALGIGAR